MSLRDSRPIREIAISKFKVNCSSLLDEVSKTRPPLRITRRGKALEVVIPATPEGNDRSWLGSMAGSMKIVGDIISPVIDLDDIEALKD